jgi:hypothetical protein
MIRSLRMLLCALAMVVLPAIAAAETVVLRNDLNVPVIVQGTCVIKGKAVRSKPVLVQPGDSANIVLPGNKIITVYDARMPSVLLNQSTVPAAKEDQYFSLQVDTPTKAKLEPFTPTGK